MKCNEIKNKMMDYIFNGLSEDENKLMITHLKSCPECNTEVENFNSTVKVIKKWPEIEPKEKMVFVTPKTSWIENVKKIFQSESKSSNVWRWTGRLAVVAIILAVLIFRSEFRYNEGQFSLTIGANQEISSPTTSPEIVAAFKKLQDEIYYTQQMLAESNKQNRELILTGVGQLAQKMDNQRIEDLGFVGQNIQRLEKTNLYNIKQMGDFIKTVAAYPEKK